MPPRSSSNANPRRRQPGRRAHSPSADVDLDTDPIAPSSNQAQPAESQPLAKENAEFGVPDSTTVSGAPTWTPPSMDTNPVRPADLSRPERPVQRLDSIWTASPGRTYPPIGQSGADNQGSKLKFQPKPRSRRSKLERDAEEKADAERRAARVVSRPVQDRGIDSGRRRGRGGIGDVGFQNQRVDANREASGAFGGATVRENIVSKPSRGGGRGGTSAHRGGRSGPQDPSVESATSPASKPGPRANKRPAVKSESKKSRGTATGSSRSDKKVGTGVKEEDEHPSYLSSEGELDDDPAPRVNIEDIDYINLVSDADSEDELTHQSTLLKNERHQSTSKMRSWTTRPVRLERHEHIERAVGVNTDVKSITSAQLRREAKKRHEADGSLFLPEDEATSTTRAQTKSTSKLKDVEFVRNQRKWKGVYQEEGDGENKVQIKNEPKDDDISGHKGLSGISLAEPDAMEIDQEPATVTPLAKAQEKEPTSADDENAAQPFTVMGDSGPISYGNDTQPGREKRVKRNGFHLPIDPDDSGDNEHDVEDENADFADLFALQQELEDEESHAAAPARSAKGRQHDLKTSDLKSDGERKDRVYFFQLPPILPSLRDVTKKSPKIKAEDKRSKTAPASEGSKAAVPTNPLNTHPKDEPSGQSELDGRSHNETIPHSYTADSFGAPGGRVGTLSMYEDGRMTADWGGLPLEINEGSQRAGLAQEIMITQYSRAMVKVENDAKWANQINLGQEGWSMGHVSGGFVGVPDLDSLLG